ncbi:hypothetical protein KFL_012670050, partial [Klebsormidium nitens]
FQELAHRKFRKEGSVAPKEQTPPVEIPQASTKNGKSTKETGGLVPRPTAFPRGLRWVHTPYPSSGRAAEGQQEKAPTAKPMAPLRVTARATNQVRLTEADRYSEADSERPPDEDFDTAWLTQQDPPRPPPAGRYRDRNNGARNERPPQQGRSNFPPTKPRACFNCGKTGHVQMNCPEPQKNTARWANGEKVDYGYTDCDTETVYEDCEPPTILHSTFEGEWVPDTPSPRRASGTAPAAPRKERVCHSCGVKGTVRTCLPHLAPSCPNGPCTRARTKMSQPKVPPQKTKSSPQKEKMPLRQTRSKRATQEEPQVHLVTRPIVWEHQPELDLSDEESYEEEDYGNVRVTRSGPEVLDPYGARARMPAHRTPVIITPPLAPRQVPQPLGRDTHRQPARSQQAPAAAALHPSGRPRGIAPATEHAAGRATSNPPVPCPSVTGTFPLSWFKTEPYLAHGSPQLLQDMSRTLRKVGQLAATSADPTNEPVVRNATTFPTPEPPVGEGTFWDRTR